MIDLALVLVCASGVAPQTVAAIVQTESAGRVLALNANPAVPSLIQPRTVGAAVVLTERLLSTGHSVDIGLMQVNSFHLERFALTPRDLFEPCTNLRVGTMILIEFYSAAARRFGAHSALTLRAALSAYNTGSFTRGISNGYVQKVQRNGRLVSSTGWTGNSPLYRDRQVAGSPIQVEFSQTSPRFGQSAHAEGVDSGPEPDARPPTSDPAGAAARGISFGQSSAWR